jgi:hypothetical protein
MTPDEAAIQEYSALREEILAQVDRRNSRLAVTWAGISALLVTGAIARTPELGCVALLLVCSGWVDELRWVDNTLRIGSYIRIILEPQIEGLQWERALRLVWEESHKKPSFFRRLLRRMFFPYFFSYEIFAVASMALSIILYLEAVPISLIRTVLFLGLFLIGSIYSIRLFVEANDFPSKKRRMWDERFSKISEQLKFHA